MKNEWRITSGDWFLPQKEYWQPNRHHDFVIASQHLLLALKAVQNWFSFDATSRLHSGFWMPIVFMGSLQWKRATSSYAKLAVSGLKSLNLPVGASGLKAEMKQGSKCTAQEGANPHDPEILQHAALSWCLASFRSLEVNDIRADLPESLRLPGWRIWKLLLPCRVWKIVEYIYEADWSQGTSTCCKDDKKTTLVLCINLSS